MKKLVVIDDEYIVVEGIRAIINKLNLDVDIVGSATDGVSGLEVIRETRPDVVITDIRMPALDGLSMIETVKEEFPEVYFVIISGYTDFAYAKRAIQLGVVGYIDKPITIEKIQDVFDSVDKKEIRKQGEKLSVHKDEGVVNSLITGDIAGFVENTELYLKELEREYREFGILKENCYRFICLIQELFAGKRKTYDEQILIPYMEVIQIDCKEELFGFVRKHVKKMAAIMEMENVECGNRVIKQLLQYINENFHRDIGLTELAEMAGMNPAYLSILFKEEVGTSYVKYLTELRIKKAKMLLQKGHKVMDVSTMVGYNNYRYFTEIFKKHVGQTPNEFKGN